MTPSILLLDDDPYFRRQVVPVLEAHGFSVLEATKGSAAMRQLERSRPDAVIVDGLLPDTNGIDWIARVRIKDADLPLVFVSAFFRDLSSYKRLTRDLGVARVFYKPLAPEVLAQQMQELLGVERSVPAETPAEEDPDVFFVAEAPEGDDELAELRRAYRRRLPSAVRRLGDAVRKASGAPADRDQLAELRRQAHRLRGTAGAHGLPGVSDAAGTIEDAIVGAGEDEVAGSGLWGRIEKALDTIQSEVGEGPRASAPALTRSPGLVARVLVLDDDPTFVEHLATAAHDRLIEVVGGSDLAEALSGDTSRPPDLALVGIPFGSPDRSEDALRELRAKLPDMPLGVVALDDSLDERMRASKAGATLFLPHPVDVETLGRAVRELTPAPDHVPRVAALLPEEETLARLDAALSGADVRPIRGVASVLHELERIQPDVVVLADDLGDVRGTELCEVLRATPEWSDIPLLLCVADMKNRIAALRAGADDTLLASDSEHWEDLVGLCVAHSRRAGRRTDLDPLTQLPARHLVLPQLTARLAESRRHGRPFTVGVARVEELSKVRGMHGLVGGARVLAGLGRLLLARMRVEDVRGRLGEADFVIGLAGVDAQTMTPVLHRMRRDFARLPFTGHDGETFHSGFRAGLASYPDDGSSLDALLAACEGQLD